jgi:hypothetical protein
VHVVAAQEAERATPRLGIEPHQDEPERTVLEVVRQLLEDPPERTASLAALDLGGKVDAGLSETT